MSGGASSDYHTALAEIAFERERQQSVEGWTREHDDGHGAGELAAAAAAYAFSAATEGRHYAADPLGFWPWDAAWWKPKGARRDLVRAGALIVAEIERLDRSASDFAERRNQVRAEPIPAALSASSGAELALRILRKQIAWEEAQEAKPRNGKIANACHGYAAMVLGKAADRIAAYAMIQTPPNDVAGLVAGLRALDCIMVEICEPHHGNPSANIIPVERAKLLAALSAEPVAGEGAAVKTCDILPPRHMPEALPGASGCILPRGHFSDHIERIGGEYYFWTDGQACDCCDPADPDRCFDFGKAAALATPVPVDAGGALSIGDKVEVIGQYEADFRGQDWWVAGIRVHDSGEGLDITLAEQWPIPNRHWREYRGQTDGFRPEELRVVKALPPASSTPGGDHSGDANDMIVVPASVVKAFMRNRVGELPGRGWLRDNDEVRRATNDLAAAYLKASRLSGRENRHD